MIFEYFFLLLFLLSLFLLLFVPLSPVPGRGDSLLLLFTLPYPSPLIAGMMIAPGQEETEMVLEGDIAWPEADEEEMP